MRWLFVAGLVLVIFFLIFRSKARRSRSEVISYIENHANGAEGGWDWDEFTSIRISDPALEAARVECVRIEDEKLPWERREAWLDVARKLRASPLDTAINSR
jgi:hypothetical protein